MKNRILLTLLFLSISLTGFSTVWTVTNSGNSFSPPNITATVGDTIIFNLANIHNVIEVNQSTWNANGNTALSGGFQAPYGGGTVFTATLSVGTLYYVCSPHAAMGMKGTIIVQDCNTPAVPNAISGTALVCASSASTYSVTSVAGATSYTWTLPNGWTGASTTNSIDAIAGNIGGTISVSANNACGASAEEMLTVTVRAADITVTQVNDSTLIANASGASYQWINCNNNEAIAGATNQSFQASINGSYAVIVTENGCFDTSICYNITITGVGIGKNNTPNFTMIYPNPSNGQFHITVDQGYFNSSYTIKIYNLIGKEIYQTIAYSTDFAIDLSKQAKGVYILSLQNGQQVFKKKIILK